MGLDLFARHTQRFRAGLSSPAPPELNRAVYYRCG